MRRLNFMIMMIILGSLILSCSQSREISDVSPGFSAVGGPIIGPNGGVIQTPVTNVSDLLALFEAQREREESNFQPGLYEGIFEDTALSDNGSQAFRRYTVTNSSASWVDHALSLSLRNLIPNLQFNFPGVVNFDTRRRDDHLGSIIEGSQGTYNFDNRIGSIIQRAMTPSSNVVFRQSSLQIANSQGQPLNIRAFHLEDFTEGIAFTFSPDVPIWANPIAVEISGFNPRAQILRGLRLVE